MTPVLRVPMVSLVGEITRQQLPTRTATFGLRQSLFRQEVPAYQERAPSSHTGELSSRESLERTNPRAAYSSAFDFANLQKKSNDRDGNCNQRVTETTAPEGNFFERSVRVFMCSRGHCHRRVRQLGDFFRTERVNANASFDELCVYLFEVEFGFADLHPRALGSLQGFRCRVNIQAQLQNGGLHAADLHHRCIVRMTSRTNANAFRAEHAVVSLSDFVVFVTDNASG